jgi:hypothetical protein
VYIKQNIVIAAGKIFAIQQGKSINKYFSKHRHELFDVRNKKLLEAFPVYPSSRVVGKFQAKMKGKTSIFCALVLIFCHKLDFCDAEFNDTFFKGKPSQVNDELVEAVNSIMENVFFKRFSTVNVITAYNNSKNYTVMDFKDKLFQMNRGFSIYRLDNHTHIQTIKNRLKIYNTILLDSWESYLEFDKSLNSKYFNYRGYYLIVLIYGKITQLDKIFEMMFKKSIVNVNAIYDERKIIKLVTFSPFKPNSCGDTNRFHWATYKSGKNFTKSGVNSMISGQNFTESGMNFTESRVNSMINFTENRLNFTESGLNFTKSVVENATKAKGSLDWKDVFPDDFKNFHKCPIRVTLFNRCPATCVKIKDNETRISGFDMSIMEEISKILNFNLTRDILYGAEQWGTITNGTNATGAIKQSDVTIGNFLLRQSRVEVMDPSISYLSFPVVFTIPLGIRLSPFEKLLRPFELVVWILMLIFICSGLLIIFIINWKFKEVRNFIYGTGIKNPVVNMTIAIFGGSQKKLPGRNFSRFLLMMFLLFCLVQRNVYQGILYIFLQSDGRHKEVQSINEMVDKGFTFYMYDSYSEIVMNQTEVYNK